MESTKQIIPDTRGDSSAVAGAITRLNSVRCVAIDAVTNRNVWYRIPPSVLHSGRNGKCCTRRTQEQGPQEEKGLSRDRRAALTSCCLPSAWGLMESGIMEKLAERNPQV